jgi:hypothetical protein
MNIEQAKTLVAHRLSLHTWEAKQSAAKIPILKQNSKNIAETNQAACKALGIELEYLATLNQLG